MVTLTINQLSQLQHVPSFAFRCSISKASEVNTTIISNAYVNRVRFPVLSEAPITIPIQYMNKYIPGRIDLGTLDLDIYGFDITVKKLQEFTKFFVLNIQDGNVVSIVDFQNVNNSLFTVLLDILNMSNGQVITKYTFHNCILVSLNVNPISWTDNTLMSIALSFRVNKVEASNKTG
jgi:hypothetical protein